MRRSNERRLFFLANGAGNFFDDFREDRLVADSANDIRFAFIVPRASVGARC
jgi:hypothetical protein